MNRIQIFAGNWKMNFAPTDALKYFKDLGSIRNTCLSNTHQVIFPVAYALGADVQEQAAACKISLGAQNMHWEDQGAFTGELSGVALKAMGISWVLIGHSERRQYFGETDSTASKRFAKAAQLGLNIVYCIGENLQEREAGKTNDVLSEQIKALSPALNSGLTQKHSIWSIAYEPIWAIGTGRTASPEQAEQAHQQIRICLEKNVNAQFAASMPILYGGSVTAENCAGITKQPNIDGVLVGGASLKPESFARILACAEVSG